MVDYIIVGQGLVGSLIAFKLMQRGKKIMIVDNKHKSAASKVAAGLVNPITGRRFVKSWMIDDLIPEVKKTYTEIEDFFSINIIKQRNIFRTLISIESENNWFARMGEEGYQGYALPVEREGLFTDIIREDYVYATIGSSYQVNIELMIRTMQEYFLKKELIIVDDFDYEQLEINEDTVAYKGVNSKKVIFCEGYKAMSNPFFNYLPFEPVKGQVVKFRFEQNDIDKIIKHNQYIVPLGAGDYWSGGGYNWDELDEVPTNDFLDQWKKQIDAFLKVDYTIVSHQAGVRPSTSRRKPFLGKHEKYKHLYILNGMGTKGTSLAPYFSTELIEHIEDGRPITKEANIIRY